MSLSWWARQAMTLADPRVTATAGRVLLERDGASRARRLRASLSDSILQRTRPSRETMRVLKLRPGGRLAWASVPVPPPPGPLGAIVRPLAIATCDLDRPMMLGATPFAVPLCFGHECVAEVLAVGSEVRDVRAGQRVVVPFQISCGSCPACLAGHTGNCLSVPPLSMYGFGLAAGHWGGAVAEQLAVPFADGMLVPLPETVEPVRAASAADNICDAYRHVAPHLPALVANGSAPRVLIVGAVTRGQLFTASVPLYAGLVATALGAGEVIVIDARRKVRQAAENLGLLGLAPTQAKRLGMAPLVIDISTTPAGLRYAVGLTAPDGVCTSSGSLHAAGRLPLALMFGRNITVKTGRTHARAAIPGVLELIASGRLEPERVTTLVAGFDDAQRALSDHARGASTKTIITA